MTKEERALVKFANAHFNVYLTLWRKYHPHTSLTTEGKRNLAALTRLATATESMHRSNAVGTHSK